MIGKYDIVSLILLNLIAIPGGFALAGMLWHLHIIVNQGCLVIGFTAAFGLVNIAWADINLWRNSR